VTSRRGPQRRSESSFQAQVIRTARSLGWRHYHTHDSRRSEPGFPDLVLVRERLVFVELKRSPGDHLSIAQRAWALDLVAAGAEVHCWDPAWWMRILAILAPTGSGPLPSVVAARLAAQVAHR